MQFAPTFPNPREARLAQTSAQILSVKLGDCSDTVAICLADDERDTIELPSTAVRLLIDLLNEMAKGNAISLIPMHAELTTQQAADLLNVSRGFLIKLLDQGQIPCRLVGTHRRIRFNDLKTYDERSTQSRQKALDQLTKESQSLGMGYE